MTVTTQAPGPGPVTYVLVFYRNRHFINEAPHYYDATQQYSKGGIRTNLDSRDNTGSLLTAGEQLYSTNTSSTGLKFKPFSIVVRSVNGSHGVVGEHPVLDSQHSDRRP